MRKMITACIVGPWTAMFLAAAPAYWPQWRGPDRNGVIQGTPWPERLSAANFKEAWRVDLAPSYSGTIVWDDLVITTETVEKRAEVVRALDRQTGKTIWRKEWEGAISVPFFAKSNGDWIRSTPACDGESLFVAGMRDVLVCLDLRTGAERWRYDFVKQQSAPVPSFGFVCSPLLDEQAVYVQAGAGFAKLDKRTGKLLWHVLKDEGGMWGSAFSSPVFAELEGERQLLVQTRTTLNGVNPANGKVLWSQPVEAFRGMNILTPVAHSNLVFTSTYGGKTIAFKVAKSAAGQWTAQEAWTHKAQGYMSTPVVRDGIAYHHLKSQRIIALDLKTGAEQWTSPESFGKYWSLVMQGDRILALDQRGILVLLKANPKQFEVLGRLKLESTDTWAHLTVCDDEVYVRELNGLVKYHWRAAN